MADPCSDEEAVEGSAGTRGTIDRILVAEASQVACPMVERLGVGHYWMERQRIEAALFSPHRHLGLACLGDPSLLSRHHTEGLEVDL